MAKKCTFQIAGIIFFNYFLWLSPCFLFSLLQVQSDKVINKSKSLLRSGRDSDNSVSSVSSTFSSVSSVGSQRPSLTSNTLTPRYDRRRHFSRFDLAHYSLHDLQLDYLKEELVTDEELTAMHKKFVESYEKKCEVSALSLSLSLSLSLFLSLSFSLSFSLSLLSLSLSLSPFLSDPSPLSLCAVFLSLPQGEFHLLADDGYVHSHIGMHMLEAGMTTLWSKLLTDLRWVSAKLKNCGIADLLNDYLKIIESYRRPKVRTQSLFDHKNDTVIQDYY